MEENSYSLRYLPLFYKDLEEVVTYIAEVLHNSKAANDLLDEIEIAIKKRRPFAESFEKYHSVKERQYPYYRIYVRNFVIFYVVIDDDPQQKVMEVRRLLYNMRDKDKSI